MAPGLLAEVSDRTVEYSNGIHSKGIDRQPLKVSGALDQFTFEEATPVIGREYPTLNIVDDLLNASNSDELLRDLAITSKPEQHRPLICLLTLTSLRAWCRVLSQTGQSDRRPTEAARSEAGTAQWKASLIITSCAPSAQQHIRIWRGGQRDFSH
jgi:hypothetical protein